MIVEENYHKEYYKKNKGRSKANFKTWYSKPENKEKMKVYMRNYMRKKKGVKKEDYRINGEGEFPKNKSKKLHSKSYIESIKKKDTKNPKTKLCGTIYCGSREPEEQTPKKKGHESLWKSNKELRGTINAKEELIERLAKENINLIEELIVIKKYLQLRGIELPD